MHTSNSQRALQALTTGQAGTDPDRKRKREQLKKVCNRSVMWEYAVGRSLPSAARASEIETASEGDVPANGWGPDPVEGAPPSEAIEASS